MRPLSIVFCVLVVLFSVHLAQARIIHVPADSSTIQGGINGAINGDTVLVSESQYYEQINFLGKAILVTSDFMNDSNPLHIQNTIIDGDSSGSVISFATGEDSTSIVQGFTIQNGLAIWGGGIYCNQSSPSIHHCTIVNNIAEGGGGIYCSESSPVIDSCSIGGNKARWYFIENGNDFTPGFPPKSGSPGAGCGGGILCVISSHPTVSNCNIGGNYAFYSYVGGSGGGISCWNSSPEITNCIIEYNAIGAGLNLGGGISCWDCSSPIITDCIIQLNSGGFGGGIACDTSSPVINRCIVIHNYAGVDGGGISCWRTTWPTIVNCTITRNTAEHGGAISCHDCGLVSNITNCILWDNSPDEIYASSGPPPVFGVTYSDIKGGWPGTGNLNCCPQFCNPIVDNYYLAESSCCVGAGQGGVDIGTLGIGCSGYIAGDANGDGQTDVGDVVYLINYLFKGGNAPNPTGSGDTNCDGKVDIGDVVYLINYLFKSGPPPTC